MKLSGIKNVYMVGIKGTGMSALALVLAKLGISVSGSDKEGSFFLIKEHNFTNAEIKIYNSFNLENIPEDIDLVVVSTIYNNSDNIEVEELKRRNIEIVTYPEILGVLTSNFKTISVCGSHGKTTTTNLTAHIAISSGLDYIAISGPTSQQVIDEINVSVTDSPEGLILESDEYENKLQYYNPFGVILTNIELDHPDYFKSEEQYIKVFSDYVSRIPEEGFLVYCSDDKNTEKVAEHAKCNKFAYGVDNVEEFSSPLLGVHNILNTTASFLALKQLGITKEQFQSALSIFKGSDRRLEKISDEPLIYDDYGHHPTEIKATLEALRSKYSSKTIWAIFQAHTYTRTEKFLKEFGESFKDADDVIVLDIWGSARENKGNVHAKDIVKEIEQNGTTAYYIPTREEASEFIKNKLNKDTLIVTIGASDIWKIHKLIIE